MKRIYIALMALGASLPMAAQESYENMKIAVEDLNGSARYVGMGGALGALGADMSVISWNPAGIGLYRKNDIAMTFGGTWGKSRIDQYNRGKGTFDQAGFVYNIQTGSESCPYVNFAFNFQKKINFNHNFYAVGDNLGGLSQMDQLAELTYWDNGQTNLPGLAIERNMLESAVDENGETYYYNYYASYANKYTHHSEGSLQAFDFNLSTNISNRAFLGLTVGLDNMRYRGMSLYEESGDGDYALSCNYDISGIGVNVKLGTIIRPIESSSLRFGLTVETPTWYNLRSSTWFDFGYTLDDNKAWEASFKFSLRSPWKVRASLGSTIGSAFAWDVDYEYAAYAGLGMSWPDESGYYHVSSESTKDVAMNQLTRHTLRGTHTLRAGIEANATKNLAFRLGYNLSTSAYKKNISFDQYNLNSRAMDYATGTSYMRMGTTNILTLGIGYHTKSFYADLAYKIRNQSADFYAFDTSFTDAESGDPVFLNNAPELVGATIDPVDVDLTRHAVTCTLGFKF